MSIDSQSLHDAQDSEREEIKKSYAEGGLALGQATLGAFIADMNAQQIGRHEIITATDDEAEEALAAIDKQDALAEIREEAYDPSLRLRKMMKAKIAEVEEAKRKEDQEERQRRKRQERDSARLRQQRCRARKKPKRALKPDAVPLPVPYSTNGLLRSLTIWTQVSSSKRAEKLRQEGEARLRQLVKFVYLYRWYLNQHGRPPSDSEIAHHKALHCSRNVARHTRKLVAALLSPTGPWHPRA